MGVLGNVMLVLDVFVVLREFDNWPAFLGGKAESVGVGG